MTMADCERPTFDLLRFFAEDDSRISMSVCDTIPAKKKIQFNVVYDMALCILYLSRDTNYVTIITCTSVL